MRPSAAWLSSASRRGRRPRGRRGGRSPRPPPPRKATGLFRAVSRPVFGGSRVTGSRTSHASVELELPLMSPPRRDRSSSSRLIRMQISARSRRSAPAVRTSASPLVLRRCCRGSRSDWGVRQEMPPDIMSSPVDASTGMCSSSRRALGLDEATASTWMTGCLEMSEWQAPHRAQPSGTSVRSRRGTSLGAD